MSSDDPIVLMGILVDRSRSDAERARAAGQLAAHGHREAMNALLDVASDQTNSEEVLVAAGSSLAQLYLLDDRVLDAPLHRFTGAAYLAFDDVVARAQRRE